jgi:hypothetical protein
MSMNWLEGVPEDFAPVGTPLHADSYWARNWPIAVAISSTWVSRAK